MVVVVVVVMVCVWGGNEGGREGVLFTENESESSGHSHCCRALCSSWIEWTLTVSLTDAPTKVFSHEWAGMAVPVARHR